MRKVVGDADGQALRRENVAIAEQFAPDLIFVIDTRPDRPVNPIFNSAAWRHHKPRVGASTSGCL